MLSLIAINGTWLKTPAQIEWSENDIADPKSARTLDGTMHLSIVARKAKLSCKWPAMTFEDATIVLNALGSMDSFSMTYYDIKTNGYRTSNFYSGDRSGNYKWVLENSKVVENLSCDMIEV